VTAKGRGGGVKITFFVKRLSLSEKDFRSITAHSRETWGEGVGDVVAMPTVLHPRSNENRGVKGGLEFRGKKVKKVHITARSKKDQ